jgi:hypothetical protein
LVGLSVGAGLMYILDPDKGRRRRALVRDQGLRLIDAMGDLGDRLEGITELVTDRVRGIAYETQTRLQNEVVPDDVLIERVRAKLGRVVSHPRAIIVTINQGRVTLGGPILAQEVGRLLTTVRLVRGVKQVENQLEIYETPDNIPSLQGIPRENKRTLF